MIMMRRMTLYTVHIKPGESLLNQRPIFVKEGFNFVAFLVPFIWSLYQRLWAVAFALAACNVALMFMGQAQWLGPLSIMVLNFAMNVYTGLSGNDWLRARLSRRGYLLADIAVADSLLHAQQRYFDRSLALKPA
ncbi:MAG: DUF2628 domain-containing protein [Proteobacteria bacterium]|nr:DUF2628 domain-containing protein [Pseudomonadota bacterium]